MKINQSDVAALRREIDLDQEILAELYASKVKCIDEILDILKFVAEIEDSNTRQIFKLRFILGYTWQQISSRIGTIGDGSTERKIVERYLKRMED